MPETMTSSVPLTQPPRSVLLLGLAAGAVEGVIVGVLHGGINSVVLSVLWGAMIGMIFGALAWRARRRIHQLIASVLFGLAIEIIGGCVIVIFAPAFARIPVAEMAFSCLSGLVIVFPILSALRLIYWEILGALRGWIAGVVLGAIGLAIVMGSMVAEAAGQEIGMAPAIALGAFTGVLMGIMGGTFLGPFLGALTAALLNVNRRPLLPTVGGVAGAVGCGLAGRFVGEEIAGDGSAVIGLLLGIGYGAMIGVKLGRLAAPQWLARNGRKQCRSSDIPSIVDLSNPRELIDANELPRTLLQVLLGAIYYHVREVRIEPQDSQFRLILLPPCPNPPQLLLLAEAVQLLTVLEELAHLTPRREGDLQVRIRSCRVDVHLLFEPTADGERVIMQLRHDPGAAEAALRVCKQMWRIWHARQWFSAKGQLRFVTR